jgi:thioredoxin-like negative regulator of GroEL
MKQAIYFTAEWCGPCQALKPQIQASGLPIQIVNVDQNKSLTESKGVRNVPTIILMESGREVSRLVGNNININTLKQFFN